MSTRNAQPSHTRLPRNGQQSSHTLLVMVSTLYSNNHLNTSESVHDNRPHSAIHHRIATHHIIATRMQNTRTHLIVSPIQSSQFSSMTIPRHFDPSNHIPLILPVLQRVAAILTSLPRKQGALLTTAPDKAFAGRDGYLEVKSRCSEVRVGIGDWKRSGEVMMRVCRDAAC